MRMAAIYQSLWRRAKDWQPDLHADDRRSSAAMLSACIGAIQFGVPGVCSHSLATRIDDASSIAIVSADAGMRVASPVPHISTCWMRPSAWPSNASPPRC